MAIEKLKYFSVGLNLYILCKGNRQSALDVK